MGIPISIREQLSVNGKTYKRSVAAEPDLVAFEGAKTLAAAKTGTLTTRTDNDTGTLTMANGHGITTGAILDVYWDGGMRIGMTVGTVATNSVPIDGGSGDNLPVATTTITAMVPQSETLVTTGNDYTALAADAPAGVPACVTITDGSDVVQALLRIDEDYGAYIWHSASGVTNPLAGDTTAKLKFSHGDSSGTRTVRAVGMRS